MTPIKPGDRCTQCAQPLVPYINRDGLHIRYFTTNMQEICRRCAEPPSRAPRR